jgi:hypothetical protein
MWSLVASTFCLHIFTRNYEMREESLSDSYRPYLLGIARLRESASAGSSYPHPGSSSARPTQLTELTHLGLECSLHERANAPPPGNGWTKSAKRRTPAGASAPKRAEREEGRCQAGGLPSPPLPLREVDLRPRSGWKAQN